MNTILENLFEQVDGDGWDTGLKYEIISFRSDPNISLQKGDDAFTRVNKIDKRVITTNGWDVEVKWSEQSTDWVPLSMIEE